MKLSSLPIALAAISGILQVALCLPGNDGASTGMPRTKAATPRQNVAAPPVEEDRVEVPQLDDPPKLNFGNFRQLRERLREERRQRERAAEEAAKDRETKNPDDPGPAPNPIPKEDPVIVPKEDPVIVPDDPGPTPNPIPEDPVNIPKEDPVIVPTADPVIVPDDPGPTPNPIPEDPVHVPEEDPVIIPKEDPVIVPTEDPVIVPTADPVHVPTADPVHVPTADPVHVPEEDPVHVPEEDPVHVPEEDPVHVPTEAPVHVPSDDDSDSIKEIDYNGKEDKATQTDQEQDARLYRLKEDAREADETNEQDQQPPIGWLIPARLRDPGYTLSIQAKALDFVTSAAGQDISQKVYHRADSLMGEAAGRVQEMTSIDQIMNYLRDVDIFFDTLLEVYSMATYDIIERLKLGLTPQATEKLRGAVKESYEIYLGWVIHEVAPKIVDLLGKRLEDIESLPRESQADTLITGLERYISFTETMAGLFTLRDLYVFPLRAPEGVENPQGLAGLIFPREYSKVIESLEKRAQDSLNTHDEVKRVLQSRLNFQPWNQGDYDTAMETYQAVAHSAEINAEEARDLQEARALFRMAWAASSDFFYYRALKRFKKIAKYEALLPNYTSFKDQWPAKTAWGTIIELTEKDAILFSRMQNNFDKQILRCPNGAELLKKIYKDHDEVLF